MQEKKVIENLTSIIFKLEEEEKRKIVKASHKAEKNLSAFCRDTLLREADRIITE